MQRRAAAALSPVWPGCAVTELRPLPGGASSLTFVAEVTGAPPGPAGAPRDRVVVKMAPPGLAPLRNRDVLRQARVLRALELVPDVAVPAVHAADSGDPPQTPPLFVMDYVAGESYEPLLTAHGSRGDPPPDDQVAARALAAVRMLAALHGQDAAQLGLADEPAITLPEEYAKWAKALATCDLSDDEALLERECRARLERGASRSRCRRRCCTVTGGSATCNAVGQQVRAVIDWEIWSIGDPRTDLAWMMMWASPDNPGASSPAAFMIAPQQLLAWYEEAAGRDVDELGWVAGLIRYKSAATTALLVKNAEQARRGRRARRAHAPQHQRHAGLGPRRSCHEQRPADPGWNGVTDSFLLTGKVALVTGGSRGLGREMVRAFARAGADVVIASRDAGVVRGTRQRDRRQRPAGLRWPSAATSATGTSCQAFLDAVYDRFGRLDVLVNNAGKSPLYPALAEVDERMWDSVLAVNLKGPFRLTALAGQRMAAGDGGSIINISSTRRRASRGRACCRTPRPKPVSTRSRPGSPWPTARTSG